MASESKHECLNDTLIIVKLAHAKILSIDKVTDPDELKSECPYCTDAYSDPAVTDKFSCECGKVPARLQCGHLVHQGCYLAAVKRNKPACPHCFKVPQAVKSDYEIKKEHMLKQPVPDVIPKLEIRFTCKPTLTLENVSSDTLLGAIADKAKAVIGHRLSMRMLIMNRVADHKLKLRDYSGVHLSGIAVQIAWG